MTDQPSADRATLLADMRAETCLVVRFVIGFEDPSGAGLTRVEILGRLPPHRADDYCVLDPQQLLDDGRSSAGR